MVNASMNQFTAEIRVAIFRLPVETASHIADEPARVGLFT